VIGDKEIRTIAGSFQAQGRCIDCMPYGHGHIHQTYLARFQTDHGVRDYILQQINSAVFRDPPAMMENILLVTSHIRQKLEAIGCQDIARQVLTVVPDATGMPYYLDERGRFWRMYVFVEDSMAVEMPQDCRQVYQAAMAFGRFDAVLADLPAARLHQTIPAFHDGRARLSQLMEVLRSDPLNRAIQAKPEIDFILGHSRILLEPSELLNAGAIRPQATHNDTKVNNVLLDRKTGQGLCVIDLDTVMEGVWLYDLGDILRTTCSVAAEDEQDLTKVQICMDRYKAAVKGFIEGSQGRIGPDQYRYISLSGQFMALIMATRFLTDFIAGDRYFKISRPSQNLDRCRCQCRLVASMLQQAGQIDAVIASAV